MCPQGGAGRRGWLVVASALIPPSRDTLDAGHHGGSGTASLAPERFKRSPMTTTNLGSLAGRRIEATVVNLHRARSPVFAAAMAAPFAERTGGVFLSTAKLDSFVNITLA